MATFIAPDLSSLPEAVAQCEALFARVDAARDGAVADEGGDASAHGSDRLVTRHVANYLAAVELARQHSADGPVVDVGCGVGALSVWAAEQLGAPLQLVDRSASARDVASRAFPKATVAEDTRDIPSGSVRAVLAMEVIEHVRPREQAGFVRELCRLLAPGGLLVMSTPDERGYMGGWSGYRPHIGTLSSAELEALLTRCAWEGQVWRLEGGPFDLGRVRAIGEPVVNRVWGALESGAPELTRRGVNALAAVGRGVGKLRGSNGEDRPADDVPTVRVTADEDGPGTGLIGMTRRPEA